MCQLVPDLPLDECNAEAGGGEQGQDFRRPGVQEATTASSSPSPAAAAPAAT